MPSDKNYLDYVLDQLSDLQEITYRKMMGEYIIYCKGKIIGGIYDNRLLIKYDKKLEEILEGASLAIPYEGAKKMYLIEDLDDKQFLSKLFITAYNKLS